METRSPIRPLSASSYLAGMAIRSLLYDGGDYDNVLTGSYPDGQDIHGS